MAAVSRENWVERIRDPKIECMSRDEMAALQSRRLVEVVNRVYNNVEFYRKKMQDMGIEPGDIKSIEDIGKLPFTTKEDLRENYPFGLLAIPKKDVVRVQGTSGTTGKLTIAPYSQKDVEVWGECVARELTMAGLTEEDIIHVCYGYGLFTGGLGLDFGARALGAMAIPMSAGNTKRQMMCMEDLGATAFACTPSYALYLAESIQEAGIVDRLNLKVGIHGAEPWTEEMRKKIEVLEHQTKVEPLLAHFALPLSSGVGGVPHGLAVHLDDAGVWPFQKIQAAQQGRLAGTRRTDDGQRLALFQSERNVLEDVGVPEIFPDAGGFEQCHN